MTLKELKEILIKSYIHYQAVIDYYNKEICNTFQVFGKLHYIEWLFKRLFNENIIEVINNEQLSDDWNAN